MTRVVFLHEAEEEMLAAARHYNAESAGLGSKFLTEVERTTEALLQHPQQVLLSEREFAGASWHAFPSDFSIKSTKTTS